MVAQLTMRTFVVIRHFDLLKAFDYIDRAVKPVLFRKRPKLLCTCATFTELPSDISTMIRTINGHVENTDKLSIGPSQLTVKETDILSNRLI